MRDDEFNSVKVNNDSQLKASNEFSFTVKNDISSYKENKSTVTRDEANDTFHIKNNENKKGSFLNSNNQEFIKNKHQGMNVDEIKKLSGESSSVSSASTVQATTATGASTTVSGVVVGAATVAVTAVAVVTGVGVI